jgi:hypothetical protein
MIVPTTMPPLVKERPNERTYQDVVQRSIKEAQVFQLSGVSTTGRNDSFELSAESESDATFNEYDAK